jgi:hypothetical protein
MTLVSHTEQTDPATSTEAAKSTRLRPAVLFWMAVIVAVPMLLLTVAGSMVLLVTWLIIR